jgi:tetratricopeptide (TPR) repeat protein
MEIATAVAKALTVRLLGDVAGKMEAGGTRNPDAFDAYLRASKAHFTWRTPEDVQRAIAGYTEAIRRDPRYALAYAGRSMANRYVADEFARGPAVHDYADKALADARAAISLAPDLAEGHLALAYLLRNSLQFRQASQEYDRAIALAPGNARVLSQYGFFAVAMGHSEAGVAAARRSVALDPLNANNQGWLGITLVNARRYSEAIAPFEEANALAANPPYLNGWLSYAYYKNGDLESARAACERESQWNKFLCMALLFEKRGRHADARAMLAKVRAAQGDGPAVFYAVIYAEWGEKATALDWLETALRERNSDSVYLKSFEAFDPLRKEPRFQAVMRELKFPD